MKTETESMIGKVFYGNNRWHGLSKHTVIRETPTQLVLNDETRIKKQDKYDFTRSVGATGWDCVLYSLATPKLDEDFKKQQMIKKIKSLMDNLKLDKISNLDLNNLYTTLSNIKP